MDNWDGSEWMQVGIKLPHCPWSRALCLSFPCGSASSLCPGGLQLLGEVWEKFQPGSSLAGAHCQLLLLLLPWHPTSLSLFQPAGVGQRGQEWWQGWNHSQEQLLGRLELRVWMFRLPPDGLVVDLHRGMWLHPGYPGGEWDAEQHHPRGICCHGNHSLK